MVKLWFRDKWSRHNYSSLCFLALELSISSKEVWFAASFSPSSVFSPPSHGFVVDMAKTDFAHVDTESLESAVKLIFHVRLEFITGVLKIQVL